MIEFFPPEKQEVIRAIMAGVLRGVISQRLLPKIDGGRVAAVEVMVMNARIADLVREGRADEVTDAVAEGDFFQMQTFTQALIEHVLAGRVDSEVAANAATNRHDFLVALEQATKRHRAAAAVTAQEAPEPAAGDGDVLTVASLGPTEPEAGLGLRIAPAG
jgi:twitching motility protein PilT